MCRYWLCTRVIGLYLPLAVASSVVTRDWAASGLKQQAAAAQSRVTTLDATAERRIESYDRVHGQYLHTRARLASTKQLCRSRVPT